MKKLNIKDLEKMTKEVLVKKIAAGYGCPTGYYWDQTKHQCVLDS